MPPMPGRQKARRAAVESWMALAWILARDNGSEGV